MLPPAFHDAMRTAGFPLGEFSPHLTARAAHPGLTPLMKSQSACWAAPALPDFSLDSAVASSVGQSRHSGSSTLQHAPPPARGHSIFPQINASTQQVSFASTASTSSAAASDADMIDSNSSDR